MEIYILASSHISAHRKHQVRDNTWVNCLVLQTKGLGGKELTGRPDLAPTVLPQNLGLSPSLQAMTIF